MMKLFTIVGARPQFIKAAMISRAILRRNAGERNPVLVEEILHTGQHYDPNMSDIFFNQMGIPQPVVNLNINGGSHGEMTGRMLPAIEAEIVARRPDQVLVYGDTNSTLAGALAASKLHVPVAHVEAGLRSFNRRMPEEINRILTDHMASLLFCPTHAAAANLAAEGIVRGVHHVGDVMHDAALVFGHLADKQSTVMTDLDLQPKGFLLATVHRAENTDNPVRLKQIFSALNRLAEDITVVFPVHPRTRGLLSSVDSNGLQPASEHLRLIKPVSFLDMVQLEKNARCILTDSGGVQKEAYFHGTPCVTLRDETEWVETVASGWNRLAGADADAIRHAVLSSAAGKEIEEYGDGHAAEAVLDVLIHSSTPNALHKHGGAPKAF